MFEEDESNSQKELRRAQNLGEVLESKIQSGAANNRLKGLIGLCATCINCHYKKTQLMDEQFICERLEYRSFKLNTSDPVMECSAYTKRGEMTLWDMKEMATLIDPPKRIPGFKRKNSDE